MRDLRSSLTLLTASGPVVPIADAKYQLRIDPADDDEDDYINTLIDAAQNHVDGRDGILGRALLTQTWRLNLESFYDPRLCYGGFNGVGAYGYYPFASSLLYPGEIKIPLPPLQSIGSIKYLDATETLQTVDPSVYRVIDGGGFASSVIPKATSGGWPAPGVLAPDAVQITFTAGYASLEALRKERQGVIHAMLLLIGHWFDNREGVTDGRINQPFEVPFAIERLLAPHGITAF